LSMTTEFELGNLCRGIFQPDDTKVLAWNPAKKYKIA
jgi:hypothetical protein